MLKKVTENSVKLNVSCRMQRVDFFGIVTIKGLISLVSFMFCKRSGDCALFCTGAKNLPIKKPDRYFFYAMLIDIIFEDIVIPIIPRSLLLSNFSVFSIPFKTALNRFK